MGMTIIIREALGDWVGSVTNPCTIQVRRHKLLRRDMSKEGENKVVWIIRVFESFDD